jgi:HTH-type transcriptional regulator/antitoxin HigA
MENVNPAAVVDEQTYRELVASALPHVIHTEQENDRYISDLEALHDRGNLSPEEEALAELLTLLIEDFERRHYVFESPSPVEVLRELMDANGLIQADLIDVFGSPSVISEVLNGKRDLSKKHIVGLSARFHVSPELFFSSAVMTAGST